MLDENKNFGPGDRALNARRKDPLRKLYVDRVEVSRVLQLWKQADHPEADERIREFESLLSSIDRQITDLEGGSTQP